MAHKRDVSPVGTSKFERPYSPPSTKTTPANSPIEATFPFSQRHPAFPSVSSSTDTYSTAPSSIDSAINKEVLGGDWRGARTHAPVDRTPTLHEEDGKQYRDMHESWSDFDKSDTDLSLPTDNAPDAATLTALQEFPLYNANGEITRFGELYDPVTVSHQRQLIIFVRYFYCPACTAYLQALSEGIPEEDYYNIPTPTSITIIGCGQPDLIPHYKQFTNCPFDMYADPTRTLFKRLGMGTTLNLGSRKPEYMKKGLLGASGDEIKIIKKSLQDPEGLRKRDLLRGGNPTQIGGEFLFEGGQVVWCHRMRDYRGHSEIGTLRTLLGLAV